MATPRQHPDIPAPDENHPRGITCPWCGKGIVRYWTHHVFVARGLRAYTPAKGWFDLKHALEGLFCRCPHCNEDFQMVAVGPGDAPPMPPPDVP